MKTTVCLNLVIALWAAAVAGAPITEPATVFYGKVTGIAGVQPFLVTDGILEWTIRRADGSGILLRTSLYPLNNGEYSYRLDVPHSVYAYDIEETPGVPLPPVSETNAHVSATVDGLAAEFVGPSGASFVAGQITRAATYRLDLEISLAPEDSDGDGMPDWWEDRHGLDKQDFSDAVGDADDDGLSNLDEYLRGFNPLFDSRMPVLATSDFLAYPDCMTGVRLDAEDVDSDATNIVYTLLVLPSHGTLQLRNYTSDPANPDLYLAAGFEFTQQDVNSGRLVFFQDTGTVSNDLFTVSVRDDVYTASTGTVEISFYDAGEGVASTVRELRRQRAHQQGLANQSVIWDGIDEFNSLTLASPSSGLTDQEYASSYIPDFGNERGQMMTGGRGDDELSGGMANDLLVGGTGDDVLTGNGGADRFIFDEGDLGADAIVDFLPEEGDVIDLSGLLGGATGMVTDYVQFGSDGTNTLLGLNLDGNGAVFSNLIVTLSDIQFSEEQAYDLILRGDVLVGNLRLKPRVSVTVADSEASENGNNSGSFVLSRTGSLSSSLEVAVSLGGSAANGTDYSALGSSITFTPGVREITLTISPIADSEIEVPETVEVTLQPGEGYVLHSASQSQLLIRDLQPVVEIQILEPLGSKDPLMPATVLVKRNGLTANPLFVLLDIGGSARNGIDYDHVPSYVDFAPGQTTIPINLLPKASGVLDDGAETVTISIADDEAYALADLYSARIILTDRRDYLDLWQAREFSGSTESSVVFAAGDEGNTGIDNLQRYAYGLNPQNPERALLPYITFRDGYACVDVFRNPGAMDIELIVEVSTDMENWDSSPSAVEKIIAPEYETEATVETYKAVEPVVVTPKLFMRVRLIYEP